MLGIGEREKTRVTGKKLADQSEEATNWAHLHTALNSESNQSHSGRQVTVLLCQDWHRYNTDINPAWQPGHHGLLQVPVTPVARFWQPLITVLWFKFILGLMFFELTKENKNWTSFKNFAPKLNLNHNIYIHHIQAFHQLT